jgi:serine protease Do
MIPRILIRHLAGSKANRIEQFQLDGAHELIIGRGPAANVMFDAELDDTVSRRHAIIKIMRNDRLSFRIADLGSSNGVRVNGRSVQDEQDLLPDDIVELSPGGPAFRIAVEPESLCLAEAASALQTSISDQNGNAPEPNQNGLIRKLNERQSPPAQEPEKTKPRPHHPRLVLMMAVAATALGASALSYRRVMYHASSWMTLPLQIPAPESAAGQAIASRPSVPVPVAAPKETPSAPPLSPTIAPIETAKTASAAIVYLEARWRLYDKFTGKPVFQKIVTRKDQRLPCFVELGDNRIVPWLTTEDEEHTNRPIGGVIRGTGFIVSGRGSIITSRRIAAGWTVQYRIETAPGGQGLLFRIASDPARESSGTLIDLTAPGDAARLIDWIPGEGGFLFRSRYPAQLGASKDDLEGRNDILDVQLPFSHVGTQAHVVRASADADVAELKIDLDRQLPVIALSNESDPRVGERITTLGYTGLLDASLDQAAAIDMTEVTGLEGRLPNPPKVASAEGTIIGVERSAATPDSGGDTANGVHGDIYQLSVKDAHLADGAPVLDDSGRALGVLVSDTSGQTTHVYAYSIQLIRALLQSQ